MRKGAARNHVTNDMGGEGTHPRAKPNFVIKIVLLTCVLGVAAITAHAEETPEWDRVKSCFDKNLVVMIRSNEPIEPVFKAVHAICQNAIDDALQQISANTKIGSEPFLKTPADVRATMIYFTERLDNILFAYAVKFKAVGGPTTLQY